MMYSLKWANNALKDSLNYFREHFRCLPLRGAKRGLSEPAELQRSDVFVFIKAFNVTPEQILASLSFGFHFLLP